MDIGGRAVVDAVPFAGIAADDHRNTTDVSKCARAPATAIRPSKPARGHPARRAVSCSKDQKCTKKTSADARDDTKKGPLRIVEEVKHNRDFIHFTPSPQLRSSNYGVVEFIKGQYRVVLWENMTERKVLLKTGVRANENEINPNYPLLAWDGKGSRLACIYWKEGKVQLFVYDIVAHFKRIKQEIPHFEQINSMQFMLNSNTLLLSAVRNGQSDIYIYDIEKDTSRTGYQRCLCRSRCKLCGVSQ